MTESVRKQMNDEGHKQRPRETKTQRDREKETEKNIFSSKAVDGQSIKCHFLQAKKPALMRGSDQDRG